mgnify:CR=1 FL=1
MSANFYNFFKLFKTEFLFDNQKFKQQLISNYKFNVNNFLNFVYGLDKLRSELRLLKKQYSESEYKNFLDKLNYQTIGINVNNYQKNVGKVIISNFNKLINSNKENFLYALEDIQDIHSESGVKEISIDRHIQLFTSKLKSVFKKTFL